MQPTTLAPEMTVQEITSRDPQRVFAAQQANRLALRATDAAARRQKLRNLLNWTMAHREDIIQALYQDFRKPATETNATEIFGLKKEIEFAIKHLPAWMRAKNVATPLALVGTRSKVMVEPKGVSLIIAPWNYPFYLVASPLASAIAAGCPAMLKPSEMTPHTAALISRMVAELFPENEVAVFEGDQGVSEALLKLPFNHIFFTGSPAVGKVVMRAAAEHLTSVTLELGGKSPAIVDQTANVQDTAEKLVWGKFINTGQTCVAPDYLLVHQSVHASLVAALQARIQQSYGDDPATSDSYARVVNGRHLARLQRLLDNALAGGARVAAGGVTHPADNYLAPTLLTHVQENMAVMQEEIFGPLLPIVAYDTVEEAIDYVNKGEKPLALYVFTTQPDNAEHILQRTSSGGACINDSVIHLANPNLPFGGSNNSGLGSSHGHYGFLAFSHEKAVMRQRVGMTAFKSLYPPYTDKVKKMMALVMKWF